ncbi:trifunctional nucleotide phosphoesterase -like, partial [Brachionus plicatilis]
MVHENLNQIIEESADGEIRQITLNDLSKETIHIEQNQQTSKNLRIIHFNDVYNIEPSNREPAGGAASMITKGKQMVPILNRFKVDIACVGNHDFDFGIESLDQLINETTFPWLISNVLDAETNKPLTIAEQKHILTFNDIKIGVIGLVEQEWMETLSTIDFDDVIYEDYVTAGRRLAHELKTLSAIIVVVVVASAVYNAALCQLVVLVKATYFLSSSISASVDRSPPSLRGHMSVNSGFKLVNRIRLCYLRGTLGPVYPISLVRRIGT